MEILHKTTQLSNTKLTTKHLITNSQQESQTQKAILTHIYISLIHPQLTQDITNLTKMNNKS